MPKKKNWKKTKETKVTIKYKTQKTGKVIMGSKETTAFGKKWWLPVHPSGHLIAGLGRSTTKRGINFQLRKYMKLHP